MKFSKTDLKKLSKKSVLKYLLSSDEVDFEATLAQVNNEEQLRALQIELIKLQNWVVEKNERVLLIFEGGEFSGKRSTIKSFMDRLNPRSARMVAVPKPTRLEKQQWYFKRYVLQLPMPGEMTFFDRSWYNRAVVEPVNGFCTEREYSKFMSVVNHFESMLFNDGVIILKIFLSISKYTQAERLKSIRKDPLRRWVLSKVDQNAQANWNKYEEYQNVMLKETNSPDVPWKIIDSNNIMSARLEAISYVLSKISRK